MAMKCTVCSHKSVESINTLLVSGHAKLRIATDHGLSESAVWNHFRKHLPKHLAESQKAEEIGSADDLLGQTRDLLNQAQSITTEARSAGDLRTAITGIGRIKDILELLMKVTWELTKAAEAKEAGPKGGPIKFVSISTQGRDDND